MSANNLEQEIARHAELAVKEHQEQDTDFVTFAGAHYGPMSGRLHLIAELISECDKQEMTRLVPIVRERHEALRPELREMRLQRQREEEERRKQATQQMTDQEKTDILNRRLEKQQSEWLDNRLRAAYFQDMTKRKTITFEAWLAEQREGLDQ